MLSREPPKHLPRAYHAWELQNSSRSLRAPSHFLKEAWLSLCKIRSSSLNTIFFLVVRSLQQLTVKSMTWSRNEADRNRQKINDKIPRVH